MAIFFSARAFTLTDQKQEAQLSQRGRAILHVSILLSHSRSFEMTSSSKA